MVLRNGVIYREFSDVSKQLFVEVATEDFGIKGRPTNISRVALLTGIDRKEVKRIRDLLEAGNASSSLFQKRDRITRVISGWYQDEEYLDQNGHPRILDIHGELNSFSQLCKKYAGDVPEGALLKELENSKVVVRNKNVIDGKTTEQVTILKREFIPVETDPEATKRAAEVMTDLGETLFNNLFEAPEKLDGKMFERRASNTNINPEKYSDFKKLVNTKGQAFLEEIDQWLSDNELPEHNLKDKNGIRLGVSTFLFGNKTPSKKAPKQNLGDEQ